MGWRSGPAPSSQGPARGPCHRKPPPETAAGPAQVVSVAPGLGSDRLPGQEVTPCRFLPPDHQKLEREARICRLLKHSNIGEHRGRGPSLPQQAACPPRPQRPPVFCIKAPSPPLLLIRGSWGQTAPWGGRGWTHPETMPALSNSPSGFSGSRQGWDVLRLQKSHTVAGYKERRLETKAHGRHSPA